jgi:hypothetical protein
MDQVQSHRMHLGTLAAALEEGGGRQQVPPEVGDEHWCWRREAGGSGGAGG